MRPLRRDFRDFATLLRLARRGALAFALLAVLAGVFFGTPAAADGPQYARTITNKLNTTGRTVTLAVPLKDAGTLLGDAVIRIAPDDSIEVSKAELATLLKGSLDAAALARLERVTAPQGYATLPALAAAGLMFTFDPLLQELNFTVATAERQTSDIRVAQPYVLQTSSRLALPAIFSGYLNVIAGVDHQWGVGSAVGAGDGRTSGRLELDSALRAWGFVLENKALYEGDVDSNICPTAARCVYEHMAGFKRQISRLVYDWPDERIRVEIGDTEALATPTQRSVETVGVSVEKSARKLAPGETGTVSTRTSLRIDRPSDVDVVVNGATLQRLHLRPGTYNLRDLPLSTGANEIKLVITDDTGQRRTETFTTFAASNQLRAGENEWAVSAGAPSYLRDNARVYDTGGDYIATSILRCGFSDALTGEAHFQADNRTTMGGGGFVVQTPAGVFALRGAISESTSGTGYAADASWDLINFSGAIAERRESLRLAAEYRSTAFHRPGDFLETASGILYPEFNYWLRVSGSYTVALDWSVAATISARYQFADPNQAVLSPLTIRGDRYGVDLSLARPLSATTSASLLLGYSNESFLRDAAQLLDNAKPDFRVSLRFNIRPDDKTTVATSYDTLDKHGTLSAYRSDGNGIGRWDTSVDTQHFGYTDTAALSGAVAYYGNRAEVRVAHNATASEASLSRLDPGGSIQRSSVRVGSSIAFADGVVAVGPPIRTGAFAIVYPHASIADKKVAVGDPESPRAVADGWGPAVVADLPAYAPQSLGIDVADLPVGYSLGAGAFDVRAPYRGGYALEVGSAYSVSVYGTLLQANGEPVGLATGVAVQPGRSDKRVTFFTNAKGKFGAEGLAPGRWQIDITTDAGPLRFAFEVPKGLDGLHRIGELRPIGGGTP